MIKSEIIANLCEKYPNLPEKVIASGVNSILEQMTQAVCQKRRVEIRGFGSLCVHYHKQRNAHNPKTGERLLTEPKYSPYFKAGKGMKERVAASYGKIEIIEDLPVPTTGDDKEIEEEAS